jgi:hypothetical protein
MGKLFPDSLQSLAPVPLPLLPNWPYSRSE